MGIAILLRHGHSSANADGVLSGRLPGVRLTATGQSQAESLAPAFVDLEVRSVWVSPLERTVQTAQLALGGRALHDEPGIIECDYGDWSGRSLKDLAEEPLWKTVQERPSDVRFPNGESLTEMARRAVTTVEHRAADDGVHVFVSHGDIIKSLVNHAAGAPFDAFQRIVVDPCSISVVVYGDAPRVLAVNVPVSGAAAVLRGLAHSDRGTVGGGGGTA